MRGVSLFVFRGKNHMKILYSAALLASLGACGGVGLVTNEVANHNINFINDAGRIAGNLPLVQTADIPRSGTATFSGGVTVDNFFTNGDAIGRLTVRVNFDDERVAMTSADYAYYDGGNGAFRGNVEGGLSMTDGVFSPVTSGGTATTGFVGTLSGAIEGGAVRANIRGGFKGDGRVDGITGGSFGNSTHDVQVYAID